MAAVKTLGEMSVDELDEDRLWEQVVTGALGRRKRDHGWAALHERYSFNKLAQGTRDRLLALGLSEEEIEGLGVGPDNVRRAVNLVRTS